VYIKVHYIVVLDGVDNGSCVQAVCGFGNTIMRLSAD